MRILDSSGAATELIREEFPDATVDKIPDGFYDAICFYGDLDNLIDPEARLAALTEHIAPGGRVYVGVQQGRHPGGHTFGRKRAWRNVDVAAMLRRHGQLEQFGVDQQGFISGCMTPCERRGEVTIFTGKAIGPWHPMDITEKGLGGSETAAWRLSEELSDLGYSVTLYGDFDQQGAVKDVILRHWSNFDPTEHRRGLIVFRSAEPFDKPVNADKVILWLEDVAGAEGLTPERAERIDHIATVSKWHSENLRETYPWLDEAKIVTSRNGITHGFFGEGHRIARLKRQISEREAILNNGCPAEERPLWEGRLKQAIAELEQARKQETETAPAREKRLLYTSSPDRGLDIVLECWPEIKRRVPDATFVHCYSRWWDLVADVNPVSAAHRARVEEMSRADGVTKVPSQGQKDLATLMRSSLVWCHPSYWTLGGEKFHETNCISSQEAQAAGCRVVCADWGALSEMVKTGVKLQGDPMSSEFRERFIEEIVKGLTDPGVQEVAQKYGPQVMEAHGWGPVAKQLEALIGG